jgi:hypothetical protein
LFIWNSNCAWGEFNLLALQTHLKLCAVPSSSSGILEWPALCPQLRRGSPIWTRLWHLGKRLPLPLPCFSCQHPCPAELACG